MRTVESFLTVCGLVLAPLLFLPCFAAWGYRPFVSTDAAVAEVKEMEIELEYFNLEIR